MSDQPIRVYGADWCIDCRRAKRFLTQYNVLYHWVNIEQDKEGEQLVLKLNKGMRSIPTIIFNDGSVLVEPSTNELARKLGISD
jgi:glutaredoxin